MVRILFIVNRGEAFFIPIFMNIFISYFCLQNTKRTELKNQF